MRWHPVIQINSKIILAAATRVGERKMIMSRSWVERRKVEGSIIHTAQKRRVIGNAKPGVIWSQKNEVLSTEWFLSSTFLNLNSSEVLRVLKSF